ncbi:MAG: rhodanese [Nitrospirae bacterium]|nr:rhodanese [Nitrospirota bacterium]MBI3595308.1 rhodanese [Nitrospirota bacterium]
MFDFQGRFAALGGEDNLSAEEIKKMIADGNSLTILDVREPWEYQTAKIEGSVLIPLGQLEKRKDELDPEMKIVCLCHMGVRSFKAMKYLQSCGFKNVKNMAGGIEAWSLKVDPAVPRYR